MSRDRDEPEFLREAYNDSIPTEAEEVAMYGLEPTQPAAQPPEGETEHGPDRVTLSVCVMCERNDRHGPLRLHHYYQGGLCHGRIVPIKYLRADLASPSPVAIREADTKPAGEQ
jgi:hypothetical protein